MTTRTDFDHHLIAWLKQAGPDDIADDVVAAACRKAESLGQRRAPWPIGPSPWPGTSSHRIPMTMVAATVALTVTVGTSLVLLGGSRNDPPVVEPLAPTPSPSIAAAFPDSLHGTWLATQPEDISFGTPSGPSTMRLVVDDGAVAVTSDALGDARILEAAPVAAGAGRALVTMRAGPAGEQEQIWAGGTGPSACRPGDVGRYAWSIRRSDGADVATEIGDLLELELVDDACAARAAVLPRTWVRSLAAAGNGGMGVVPVSTSILHAVLPPGTYEADRLGSGTRTISADGSVALGVWADPRPLLDPCDPLGGTAELGADAASFLAQLARNPAFTIDETTPVFIGGRPATAAVLRLDTDLTCPATDGATDRVPATQAYAWQAGSFEALPLVDPTTIYLVPVPDHLLVLEVRAPDAPTRDAMVGGLGFADSLDALVTRP